MLEPSQSYYVLRLDVVRRAIAALQARRIHEQFPAYLHVRERAIASDTMSGIPADWPSFSRYFLIPGGPPNKPQFRPFASIDVRDRSGFWKGKNTAGSFAPSSIRSTARFMLSPDGKQFELRPEHAQSALANLLFGDRVPAWAMTAYLLRNDGFVMDAPAGLPELLEAFRQQFRFGHDGDFDVLFDSTPPSPAQDAWFEMFVAELQEAEGVPGE